jgi:predicted ATPase with chaperone activity
VLKTLRSLSLCEIDICVEVPRVEYDLVAARRTVALGETSSKLGDDRPGQPSADIRTRVEKAREVQRQRFAGRVGGADGNVSLHCNVDTAADPGRAFCPPVF